MLRLAQEAALLPWSLVPLLVFRRSWKAFWKPRACCVELSDALMLLTKVDIFLLVSLVAGDRKVL